MKTLKKLLWLAAVLLCIVSCSKEEVTEKVIEVPEGKVLVETEIVVDGVIQSKTRASSEAGYTTGDGLYDSGDKVIVAAVANDGYELAAFYDKKYPSTNLGTSYEFPAAEPRTFKAEFARKYTITVSASPTAGGTVSGGGTYRSGKPCTLTATPNAGYTFDGWYEGSTKLSSNTSYSFTVSSNRTITGKFVILKYIAVGANGYIISPSKTQQVGTNNWNAVAYGNGKYVAAGQSGYTAYSHDGENWTPVKAGSPGYIMIIYTNGKFIALGGSGYNGELVHSEDGINWTFVNSPMSNNGSMKSIAYGNGKYCLVGNNGQMYTSNDLKSWRKVSNYNVERISWNSIAYGNGKFVAIGSFSSGEITIMNSEDGINWTFISGYASGSKTIFENNNFVIFNPSPDIYYSIDGNEWNKSIVAQSPFNIIDISYTNGKFVALGKNKSVAFSENLIDWTPLTQIKDESGNDITVALNGICVMP